MPFRASFPPPASDPPTAEHPFPGNGRGFWRTSLLLVTSAAFGGIAVAIWNRRTLALIRQQGESPTSAPVEPDSEP